MARQAIASATAAAAVLLLGLLLTAQGVRTQDATTPAASNGAGKPIVVYCEGGTVDDFASTVLLGEMHKQGIIDFKGDIVLNGDSILPSSIVVAEKFHVLANITDVPTLLSQTKAYNPFPWSYRGDSKHITELQAYKDIPCDACTYQNLKNAMDFPNAEDFLKKLLEDADEDSVSYVVTASLSNIAAVLREHPELEYKVKEILWMGGAVNVGGNVLADVDQAPPYNNWNMKAEWNVFADPFEAAFIFENTSIPVLMFPLDIADQTPVNGTFMDALTGTVNGDDGPVTDLDTLMYAMYDTIAAPQPFYRLWNTVTAAYMAPALQKYYGKSIARLNARMRSMPSRRRTFPYPPLSSPFPPLSSPFPPPLHPLRAPTLSLGSMEACLPQAHRCAHENERTAGD